MAGKKKTFPCGHKGKGRFCHRCQQEEEQARKSAAQKQHWRERLEAAPVALAHLPENVARKALLVIERLQDGEPWENLQGKRMNAMGQREIIRIKLGWHYRLICHDKEGVLEFIEVISHETYNNRCHSGGWSV